MSYTKKAINGYYGYAYYYDKDGRQRQKSAGKFKLKRDAIKSADKLERELNKLNIDLKDISLVDYYKRWYETYKGNGSLSDSSKRWYKNIYRVTKIYFKDTKLRIIKKIEYQQFINWYGKDHALKSVSKLNGAIRQCVSYAIDDDILTKDFTHNVQLTHNKDKEYKVEYLSTNEIKILKEALIKNLNPSNTSRYMILTAIYTGMRKEEIQALTWNDIDEIHGIINISGAWDERKKAFKSTKTTSSKRSISVNPELLHYLDNLKANNSIMIFRNALGTIPTSNALNKCLRNIMKQNHISKQGFHFHSLRHVHVAYLISKGVDIYAISKRLGHSNVSITLNTYSYLIDEYKAKNDSLITDKLSEL